MENPWFEAKKIFLLTTLADSVQPQNPVLARIYRNKAQLKTAQIEEESCGINLKRSTVRFWENQHKRMTKAPGGKISPYMCMFCGNSVSCDPSSFTIRFHPKTHLTAKLLRLLIRTQNGEKLGKFHENVVAKYRKSSTKMIVKCDICGKQLVHAGPSRESLVSEAPNTTNIKLRQDETLNADAAKAPPSKIDKKREKKRLRKQKQRKKLLNAEQSDLAESVVGGAMVAVGTDASLDPDSSATLMSPLTTSTPKPPKRRRMSCDSSGSGLWDQSDTLSQSKGSPSNETQPNSGQKKQSKSTNQNRSVSSLLSRTVHSSSNQATPSSSAKKRKNKDMHLQLQKLIKKDKKSRESSGSLKDFLTSI